MNETDKYNDIINLPHHVSATRKRMSLIDRAAQFSPFAALTGHEDAINETGRRTLQKAELDENAKAILNEKLQMIADFVSQSPEITVTYFKSDEKKQGGAYVSKTENVVSVDCFRRVVVFSDGSETEIDCITEIESDLFELAEF